ncbi:MAG: FAD-dependent oxidoreductase [Proteobacteria bacterium]|nr:FAD-dependent oxidoreductase [Pseudomonadota bacterium]
MRARVVVIGAGLAGLGAAWDLARRGCEVTLLERTGVPGGRSAGTIRDGYSLERGIPVVASGDRRLFSWIHETGLSGELLPLRPVESYQVFEGRVRAIRAVGGARVPRVPGLRRLDALRALRLPRLMRRYRSQLDPEAPERAARWDDRSVAEFARLYFGTSGLERWVAPAITAATLDDERELSRVAFLLHRVAVTADPDTGRVGGHAGVPRRGLHELACAAADRLRPRYEARATELRGGRGELQVDVEERKGGAPCSADAVVVATSASEAARIAEPLLTAAERDALTAARSLPGFVLSVALDGSSAFHPRQVRVPRPEASAIETWLEEPGATGGRAPAGRGLVTAAAAAGFARAHEAAPDDVVIKALCGELERLEPRLGRGILFTHLERIVVPRFEVGAYRRLDRFQRVQRDLRRSGRRLYFAGDHLIGPRPEDALVSGLRAAEALAEDLGDAS